MPERGHAHHLRALMGASLSRNALGRLSKSHDAAAATSACLAATAAGRHTATMVPLFLCFLSHGLVGQSLDIKELRANTAYIPNWKGQYQTAKGERVIIAIYGSAMKGDRLRFVANTTTWERAGTFSGFNSNLIGGVARTDDGSLTGKLEADEGELQRVHSHVDMSE